MRVRKLEGKYMDRFWGFLRMVITKATICYHVLPHFTDEKMGNNCPARSLMLLFLHY